MTAPQPGAPERPDVETLVRKVAEIIWDDVTWGNDAEGFVSLNESDWTWPGGINVGALTNSVRDRILALTRTPSVPGAAPIPEEREP